MKTIFSLRKKRVWIAGATGMVGSALLKKMKEEECSVLSPTRQDLDLSSQSAVEEWVNHYKPQVVFLLAARVGGIHANQNFAAEFIYDNLIIQTHVIHACWQNNVEKLLFLGSSCSYPKNISQPMPEDALLKGPPEETNEWYAIAKLAGIKMCQAYRKQYGCDFIVGMPTNVYGEYDNFSPEESHVVPALLRRFHEGKKLGLERIEIWGSGNPLRELMYVDDLAEACVFLMKNYSSSEIINVGCQQEISIKNLVKEIAHVVGYQGEFIFDTSKPDGIMRKALDSRKIMSLGWNAQISLSEGLKRTYSWYCTNIFQENPSNPTNYHLHESKSNEKQ